MIYFIKRLLYDVFISGSKKKKIIILFILLFLFYFKPWVLHAEEVAENEGNMQQEEQPARPDPEQPFAQTPDYTQLLESVLKEVQDMRYDLQEEKRLKAEEEEAAAEEAALFEEEQASLYALSQSQNNITYGFLENYRYYFTGSENTDTRASQYIYVFTENTNFKKEGNNLIYENGSCYFIHVPYSGAYVITEITSGSISLQQNWIYIYSNIPEARKPAVYQISKNSEIAYERLESLSMLLFALWFGFSITQLIINGYGRRSGGGV